MNKKIHVIPHTHWDREWYFTTSRSKVYLLNHIKDVLQTLEKDKQFLYYMLDGQASLLDDYIRWMPEDKNRIKQLVEAHRLLIGPWYTQSDQMVISAESIVRNLYYGIKTCEDYGGYMNVAYVPDSFGQAGNMPQIYRAFGIEDTVFWRGVSDDMVKHTDYMWQGDDGSQVFVTQIPFGYYIGGNIPEGDGDRDAFWKDVCIRKAGTGASKNIYFPQGFDQAPIRHNLCDLLKQRNKEDMDNDYRISCIEDYIHDVKKEGIKLACVKGELLNAKHMRIHRSIYSSRSDLKMLNTQVQNYITNIAEPIMSLAYQLGNLYPKHVLEEAWKLLLENAAHDSVGSCISDNANEDVYLRYKKAKDILGSLVELHERYITSALHEANDASVTFTVFQTLPQQRSAVVMKEVYLPEGNFKLCDATGREVPFIRLYKKDFTAYVTSQTIRLNPSKEIYTPDKVSRCTLALYADRLPASGYMSYTFYPAVENKEEKLHDVSKLENEYYVIQVQENGLLQIIDKHNGYIYKDQCEFVENGDDGDSFNYSPPREDMIISSRGTLQRFEQQGCSFLHILDLEYKMQVPYNLYDRKNKITNADLSIHLQVLLKKEDPIIYMKAEVDNKVESHRLCVVFDADMETKVNYADEQFGAIRRDNVHAEEMRLYKESIKLKQCKDIQGRNPINWSNDENGWQEHPISIEPCQSFVCLSNSKRTCAVFPGGVREYEIIGEKKNKLSLTLFRTYGYMGKENLLYRPGRASGETIMETPDAQLIKIMQVDFGFMTTATTFNKGNVGQEAKRYQTPAELYAYADFLNGRLLFAQEEKGIKVPSSVSFMRLKENNLLFSAWKKCEDKKGHIIRLYNPLYHEKVCDELQFYTKIKSAYYVNLLEQKNMDVLSYEGNTIYFEQIGHCKFISIYVELCD